MSWVLRWMKSRRWLKKMTIAWSTRLNKSFPVQLLNLISIISDLIWAFPKLHCTVMQEVTSPLLVGTMVYQRCLPTTRLQVLITVTARAIVANDSTWICKMVLILAPGDYATIPHGHATIRHQAGIPSVVIYNVISRRWSLSCFWEKAPPAAVFFPATPLLACNSLPTIICCQTASADLPQRYAVSQTVVQSWLSGKMVMWSIKATCQRVPLKLTISTPLPTAAI